MKPISIETYIASNNPTEAMSLLRDLGSPKPKNFDDLVNKLHIASQKFGYRVFDRLSLIDTPYRALVVSSHEDTKSNCSGCGGSCKGKSSNFASDSELELENLQEKKTEVATEYKTPTTTIVLPPTEKSGQNYFKLHPTIAGITGTLVGIGVICLIVKAIK